MRDVCIKCGIDIKPFRRRKYCPSCYRIMNSKWKHFYQHTDKGKFTQNKYLHSEKGKIVTAITKRQYQSSKDYKLWRKNYNQTPKGQAKSARQLARRRFRSTNPELYALRVLQLHTYQEPCAICGALYKETHCIDHIKALCNGGIDEWSNYQPACIECHRIKTKEDLKIYRERTINLIKIMELCCDTKT